MDTNKQKIMRHILKMEKVLDKNTLLYGPIMEVLAIHALLYQRLSGDTLEIIRNNKAITLDNLIAKDNKYFSDDITGLTNNELLEKSSVLINENELKEGFKDLIKNPEKYHRDDIIVAKVVEKIIDKLDNINRTEVNGLVDRITSVNALVFTGACFIALIVAGTLGSPFAAIPLLGLVAGIGTLATKFFYRSIPLENRLNDRITEGISSLYQVEAPQNNPYIESVTLLPQSLLTIHTGHDGLFERDIDHEIYISNTAVSDVLKNIKSEIRNGEIDLTDDFIARLASHLEGPQTSKTININDLKTMIVTIVTKSANTREIDKQPIAKQINNCLEGKDEAFNKKEASYIMSQIPADKKLSGVSTRTKDINKEISDFIKHSYKNNISETKINSPGMRL
ncbi:MAG: hypothetical protein VX335_04425 [Pseudomonadota bacterium]|nr:hypothetical protein [Pseudomonadota bacterium]